MSVEVVNLRIGGSAIRNEGLETFVRRNPVSGEVVTRAVAATVADAAAAACAAANALPDWAGIGPTQRRQLLLKAADELLSRRSRFVAAINEEIGATASWANFNVTLGASMLQEAASLTTHIRGEVIPSDKPGCLAMAIREPAGVVLGIAPWNAPVILGVRAIAAPLACGNTVVLKASEICPRTHALIVESLEAAGLSNGVVNLVTNAPKDAAEIVGVLIDHPEVRRINFTGSTKVGRLIAERAARNLKPVLLELGGKAPMIVLEDADLDEAVNAAAFGAFFNQGQICMSTERIIVIDAIADAFVEKLKAKASTLVAGDPSTGFAPLGAVFDVSTAQGIAALVKDAELKGATVPVQGKSEGVLVSACVVDHVTSTMQLFSQESFGPIVAVIRAKDENDAVSLANDSDYGLSASVFTRDTARGLKVARRVKSGICHINGPTVHDEAQMPFGGTKSSGYGRFGGTAAINEFTELRWITVETLPGHFPI